MVETLSIRGRKIDPAGLEEIRVLIQDNPQWSRRRLSEELVRCWDWRNPNGQLKDIATRDLLNRLDARGLIRLPPRQRSGGRQRLKALGSTSQGELGFGFECETGPSLLTELLPLSYHLARKGQAERVRLARYLHEHHYLGYPDPLGQLHYLVQDRQGHDVACLLFGPAAWKVAARDKFIGWSEPQRRSGLGQIANNSRFLVLVKVPHLASHLLAGILPHLRRDWEAQYGRALLLVETFVERDRFSGTCYRAANWTKVGQTQGRTRNDRHHQCQVPPKEVYLLPLVRHIRQLRVP